MGQIGILNVGAGDTKLIFDKDRPEDCARAAKTISDMIKRGYAILIEAGKDAKGEMLYQRATGFREGTCEYIIAGDPVDLNQEEQNEQPGSSASSGKTGTQDRKARGPRSTRGAPRIIHASAVSGIAVGRIAGG